METTPSPAAEDEDIDDDEQEEIRPGFDREIKPLDDTYRDLLQDFPMPDVPSPASDADSFGDFVAKEAARAKADAAPPSEPEEPLPKEEAAAGGESASPDPAEMIAEAVRAAKAREKIAEGVKAAKAEKKRRIEAGIPQSRNTKGHSIKETFKGIFMSAAILAESNLLPIDKMILALIDSFATGREKKSGRLTGPCTASNEAIAMYLGERVRYTCKRISLLQNQGKIITWSQKGTYTRRVVAPGLSKDRELTEKWIAKLETSMAR